MPKMKSQGKPKPLGRRYSCLDCGHLWVTFQKSGYSPNSEQCPQCAGFFIKRMAHKSKAKKVK